jgi:hypothetical protein
MNSTVATRVAPGDVVTVELPHSEVCMHMQVAGKVMQVEVLERGAQILTDRGTPFSFPIGHGEAGFYTDAAGLYTYLPAQQVAP